MSLQEDMAGAIRAIMERKNLSLTAFSEELGISRTALCDYVKARGNPSAATIEHMAQKLGISPAALITGLTSTGRRDIFLLLLDTLQGVSELSEEDRIRFAELFLEMMQLWEKELAAEGE